MIEEIKSGSGLSFGSGKLRELCKLLPDEGEVLVTAAHFLEICLMCYVNITILFLVNLPHKSNLVLKYVFWLLNAGETAYEF